jgi:hypothetical protein
MQATSLSSMSNNLEGEFKSVSSNVLSGAKLSQGLCKASASQLLKGVEGQFASGTSTFNLLKGIL